MRISDDLLTLNVGKELLEVYEKHENIFRLTAIKDRQGNSVGLHYNGSNLVAINDSNGHHITFAYNSQKLISQINLLSAEPRVLARYEYNKEGDLIRAYDEFGDVYEYTYQNHLITRYTDKTGRGINLKWNGKRHTARCIHEYDDNGDSDIRLTWIDDENETVVTDAYGNQTSYFYDTDNYTYRIIYPDHTEEWFFRDDRKNVTTHIHLDGSEDNYVYDDHDNLLEHIRADGSSVQYQYDADNNLIQIIDPLGNKWQRDYDAKGNLIAETNPEGETTHYAYNERGLPIQVIDAKGGSKTIQWTADGQIASHTDCSGHTSHWDYDERGRLIAHIDAEGNKTQYQYDQRSQPNKITFPDQSEEQYHFDAEGRLLSYTDALKRITTYQYDRSGRVAERTDPMGYHVRYHYDKNNRLSRLTDANGAHYTFQYNPMGSLLEEKGFDGKVTRYHYTQGSGVLSRIDEAGLQTVLEYDEMGRVSKRSRLTTHQLASGQIEQLVDDEHYLYDANGRLIESKNQDSRIQLFYDSLGNLLKEHHRYSFLGKDNTFVWRHQYDVLGNRTETLRPDGHRVAYLRYGSGHLHGITLNQHEIIAYQRDRLHREPERQMAKLSQQTVYDTMGRITQQNRVGFNERHRQYRYDMAGQMSNIRDSKNGTTRYQYDPLGRLIEAVTPLRHERFAFDPAGNRLDGLSGSLTEKTTTLNSVWGNLLKDWLGKHHEYDQRGNLIAKSENGKQEIFRWNGYNRLIQYTKDNQTTEYKYDPFGRRIAKIHNGTTTLFHWDGDVLSAESNANGTTHYIFEPDTFEPVAQFNSAPLRPQTPLTFRDYTYYTPDIDPLNQEPTPQEYLPDGLAYFHLDHLGTSIEMTDQTGNTVWEASYKAWGEVETVSGSLKQPFRFQGQYFDEESGLYLCLVK